MQKVRQTVIYIIWYEFSYAKFSLQNADCLLHFFRLFSHEYFFRVWIAGPTFSFKDNFLSLFRFFILFRSMKTSSLRKLVANSVFEVSHFLAQAHIAYCSTDKKYAEPTILAIYLVYFNSTSAPGIDKGSTIFVLVKRFRIFKVSPAALIGRQMVDLWLIQ